MVPDVMGAAGIESYKRPVRGGFPERPAPGTASRAGQQTSLADARRFRGWNNWNSQHTTSN
jgi:hypothetical protein